jgi:hypothetical protein
MDNFNKYLKYKKKYLLLKQQLGGQSKIDNTTGNFTGVEFNEDAIKDAKCFLHQGVSFVQDYVKAYITKFDKQCLENSQCQSTSNSNKFYWGDISSTVSKLIDRINELKTLDEYNNLKEEMMTEFNKVMTVTADGWKYTDFNIKMPECGIAKLK